LIRPGINSFNRGIKPVDANQSIQLQPLKPIAAAFHVADKIAAADGKGGPVVVGVKRQEFEVPEVFIEKYVDVVFTIVDQSERAHRTGLQAQVLEHALFGGKSQLALP
jgi:hypothetical protein